MRCLDASVGVSVAPQMICLLICELLVCFERSGMLGFVMRHCVYLLSRRLLSDHRDWTSIILSTINSFCSLLVQLVAFWRRVSSLRQTGTCSVQIAYFDFISGPYVLLLVWGVRAVGCGWVVVRGGLLWVGLLLVGVALSCWAILPGLSAP